VASCLAVTGATVWPAFVVGVILAIVGLMSIWLLRRRPGMLTRGLLVVGLLMFSTGVFGTDSPNAAAAAPDCRGGQSSSAAAHSSWAPSSSAARSGTTTSRATSAGATVSSTAVTAAPPSSVLDPEANASTDDDGSFVLGIENGADATAAAPAGSTLDISFGWSTNQSPSSATIEAIDPNLDCGVDAAGQGFGPSPTSSVEISCTLSGPLPLGSSNTITVSVDFGRCGVGTEPTIAVALPSGAVDADLANNEQPGAPVSPQCQLIQYG
jgi:hypothetical protein